MRIKMSVMKNRIFLSAVADEHLDPLEKLFKKNLIKKLQASKFVIEEFYKSGAAAGIGWTFENTEMIISRCAGAVVVGAPRWVCDHPENNKQFYLSSEYINYEGAIIHKYKIPTLYIMDSRIKERGIFACGSNYVICRYDKRGLSKFIQLDTFKLQFSTWLQNLNDKPHLFVGYSHVAAQIASKIISHLDKKYNMRIWDWQRDFMQGQSILEAVINASDRCNGAIFLFTKDKETTNLPNQALPSNNITFEAGYFIATKGKRRVLIIKEKGSIMPADLGGIYIWS